MDTSVDMEKTLPLSEDETRVLELYDKLQRLQLEIALITAQKNYTSSASRPQKVEDAQDDLLESRARYVLRDQVAENVIMANPILQAVHGGTNASPIERDLLGVLTERDGASVALADQTTSIKQITEDIMDVQSRTLQLSRQNVDLASQVLSLAGEAEKHKAAAVEDTEQAEQIAQLEQEVKASRQRWRVMKATASAIVAGSGVDWAADEQLRSIVLDEDDDGV